MILKITRGKNFAFIDNDGEVLHQVKISGNNDVIVKSLNNIINVKTSVRFKGELVGIPDELVLRKEGQPVEVNKASNIYLSEYLTRDLKLQGFSVEVIKE
ncbi:MULTISPECIES: hypothetical protein [Bacteria]|uniref:hypothetical protein n=1 Tax=Bacteria TaxID=2 RepID=UPI000A0FD16C|nr:hypothetical protein [Bacillus subtilis]MEC2266499.1 hypothetical protein [Bacillus subtilis]MEC4031936.1 hypothetical protein [Bacillus subtilis]MUG00758.1 hypothetical protein [Bacillus tequilensis]